MIVTVVNVALWAVITNHADRNGGKYLVIVMATVVMMMMMAMTMMMVMVMTVTTVMGLREG